MTPSSRPSRTELIANLKIELTTTLDDAKLHLNRWHNGIKCAQILSAAMDNVIAQLYAHATQIEFISTTCEKFTIIATGGYGRGTLAPKSDIDLLFLLPKTQNEADAKRHILIIEFILYALWDLNLKVGHAARSIQDCVILAKSDQTIATAMLDARFLHGNAQLFDEFQAQFSKHVFANKAASYITAKMVERETRHTHQGQTRYLVEPNIKEGKGSLRDLQTLVWLVRAAHKLPDASKIAQYAKFTPLEWRQFIRAENFLWFIRFHMHLLTNRAEERLNFELQNDIATAMHLKPARGLSGVERLMKQYFVFAKTVGQLTRIVCASLELENSAQKRFSLLSKTPKITAPLCIQNGQLSTSPLSILETDPTTIFSLFLEADTTNLPIHPDAIRAISRARLILNDQQLNDKTANSKFINLLTHTKDPESTLRSLNETGYISSFMPDFHHVEGLMQFNMYHHYTVDEHLIRTLGRVAAFRNNTEFGHIFASLTNKRVLFITALLHDIGKGYVEDHSIKGAQIAARLCPRLGLKLEETELVAWLITHHLEMSTTAFRRDVSDPKTISDFGALTHNLERLNLLYLLTIADIQAVGPTTWNSWRADLLASLYNECALYLGNPEPISAAPERIISAQNQLTVALHALEWPKGAVDAAIAHHNPNYWLKTTADECLKDAILIRATRENIAGLSTRFDLNAQPNIAIWTVCANDHPRLLSSIAGACAAQGFNIIGAQIDTTKEGFALDRIYLSIPEYTEINYNEKFKSLETCLINVLRGTSSLQKLIATRGQYIQKSKAFTVPIVVNISNQMSKNFTIIEIEALDKLGLLYEITRFLSTLNLNIASAFVATYGEKAVDAFYITDLTGQKLSSTSRINTLKKQIIEFLTKL